MGTRIPTRHHARANSPSLSSEALPQTAQGRGPARDRPMGLSWLLLACEAGDPPWNMALDETLFEWARVLEAPILRFYSWTRPAATFGYFQRYHDVAQSTSLRPLIRRPTGGGVVPHDHDWTYSLVFPPSHPWYRLKASDSYKRLHEWLRAAFRHLELSTELAPMPAMDGPGLCFVGAEQHDLLWQRRKIGGAAQRRNRAGLLIQGSIQPPPPIRRSEWEHAVCRVTAFRDVPDWTPWRLPDNLRAYALEKSEEKYAQEAYNQKR